MCSTFMSIGAILPVNNAQNFKSYKKIHRSELYESQIWTDCQIKDSPVWAELTTQGKVKRKCEKYLI